MHLLLLVALLLLPCLGRADDDGATITVWCMGSEGAAIVPFARRFEEQHPGVRVRTQSIPWGGARDRIITAFVGDISPDVIQLGTTWVPEMGAIDALLPLDELMAASPTLTAQSFFPASLEGARHGGKLVSLPWYVDTRVVFYRSDLLREAGYTAFPATWDDEIAMAKAVTKDVDGDGQIDRYAMSLPVRDDGLFMNLVWQNGGRALSEDHSRIALNSPETIGALDFYRRVIAEGYSPLDATQQLDPLQAFGRGYIASWVSGPWMVGEIRKRMPELEGKWAVSMVPGKVTRESFLGGSNLAIMKASRNPQLAWQFVEFMSQPDVQSDWFRATGDLPSSPAAWEAAGLAADPVWRVFRNQIEHGHASPPVENWEAMAEQIRAGLEQAILTDTSSAEIVAAMDARLSKMLASTAAQRPAQGNAPGVLRTVRTFALLGLIALGAFAAGVHRRAIWRARMAYLLIAPILLHFCLFLLVPMAASFLLSLTDYDLYSLRNWERTSFIGVRNYVGLSSDPIFWQSVVNTLYFVGVAGPMAVCFGLLSALALQHVSPRMRSGLTVALFLPVITPMVAVAVVWQWIYAPRDGLLNGFLGLFGVEPIAWLSNPNTAMPALILLAVWKNFGYSMVIFMGGLQSIPKDIYEAARIDGAGPWACLQRITLPLLRPIMLFVAVLTIIGFMQFFSEPYIMTDRGGPQNRTLSITLYLYKEGFTAFRLGYASAIAYTLCFMIAGLSILQSLATRTRNAA